MMTNSPTNPSSQPSIMKLLVTIVDRGKGTQVAEICNESHLYFNFLCFGRGTATSEIMDLLGLGTPDKDVIFSLMPGTRAKPMMESISERLKLGKPGRGIAFTVPITGMNRFICHILEKHEDQELKKEENPMDKGKTAKHRLIAVVTSPGFADDVMDAARAAGATGGTVIHARGLSTETVENFLGMPLQAEKEILTILVPKDNAPAIMEAINNATGLNSEAHGMVICLPVTDLAGIG